MAIRTFRAGREMKVLKNNSLIELQQGRVGRVNLSKKLEKTCVFNLYTPLYCFHLDEQTGKNMFA